MRDFKGVKNRLAIEFSGFSGNSKAFLYQFGGKQGDTTHRFYSPSDLRHIRLKLMEISSDKRPNKIPPIINFRMAKGGTGKTTTAANVSACLSMMGYRILMIDGDPQASLSGVFGVDWATQDVTHVGELMRRVNSKEATKIQDAVMPMYEDGMLDLIPASIEMAGADGWMAQIIGREQAFVRLLEKELDFFSKYDAIIIDSAPSSSLLTTAFMVASETLVAVVAPEGQSLGALNVLESNVQELNDNFKDKKYGIHIIVNRYNQSKRPHQDIMSRLVENYGNFMNDTIVRDFVGFLRETGGKVESPSGPLVETEPNSVGARDIIELTKSLIKVFGVKLGSEAARAAA